MEHSFSIHEMRRKAPLHFHARADNARLCAHVLWAGAEGLLDGAAAVVTTASYGGSPVIALSQGYQREAALALELVVKAVVAQRIESGCAMKHVTKVRAIHDVPTLWKEAELPTLSLDDQHRLLIVKSLLYWSGRYAAPNKDKDYERDREAEEALEDVVGKMGPLKIIKPRSFTCEDFDRIYNVANEAFWNLRGE